MPSNCLTLCLPLFLLPSMFPSIRKWVGSSHQEWPKYWSFSISSSSGSGLISFRTDWFDLLAVQGTLKCLIQHHNSKASILWCSAFFMVQRLYALNVCILFTDVYIWCIMPVNTRNRTGRLEVKLWHEHVWMRCGEGERETVTSLSGLNSTVWGAPWVTLTVDQLGPPKMGKK